MDHQEGLEKIKANLCLDGKQFYGHVWLREEWRITQQALFKMAMHHLLSSLERKVVKAIFFDGFSEDETARKLKVSKKKVHDIRVRALEALEDSAFIKLALSPEIKKVS